MRYLRLDGQEAPLDVSVSPAAFDLDGTIDLFNCLDRNEQIDRIFIDTVYVKIDGPGITHDSGHRNHFHVRIVDPDGPNN
ncbi:MAG: hypothetical protein ACREMJ_00425 [Gemmatimonadales bacterium]